VMWRVRDFHADDLDAAVRLWEDPAASSEAPLFGLSDLIAAVRSHQPAVVAVVGEALAGVAVATVTGDQAWVMRISLAAAWRRRGIGSAMLGELERRLVAAGVRRIVCLLAADSEIGPLALEHSGFSARREMVLYERVEPVGPGSAGILDQLGGRMVRAGAWDRLGGMAKEKELIERRVILPLAQPQLAERLGLVPPRAIVLFGPPDPAARQAIWDRYLAAVPHGELDMAAIVEESRLFTPADIEFAARRTAQLAFERVLFEHGKELVTTGDIRHAISQTRRTPELVAEFEQDITEYARM
jgi:SpoVK/Ycf46/Vps4 family AAA+-type ATPase